MLGKAPRELPTMVDYRTRGERFHVQYSLWSPSTLFWRPCAGVKAQGGVKEMERRADETCLAIL